MKNRGEPVNNQQVLEGYNKTEKGRANDPEKQDPINPNNWNENSFLNTRHKLS